MNKDKKNFRKEIKASTLHNIVLDKPVFPSGEICGKFFTYPKQSEDIEGGMRLQGKYKKDSDELPLITYITVVYNRYDTLFQCMSSVWMQTYPNIEYIIVDGASNDGTRELLEINNERIDYFISQKDKGIYNAMNKGIALASGRYICFMNSDDVCVPWAAEAIVKKAKETKADVLCGGRELWQDGIQMEEITYIRPYIRKCVFRYIQFYHQATYASPKAFETAGYFDENYRLLSDWIWEAKCIDEGLKISFFDTVLTRFNYDGASFVGMEKRDDDWIQWITNTFPKVTKKDAESLLFCLDRYREPYYELNVIMKVAKRYLEDATFKRAFYETVLYSCVDSCEDILRFVTKNNLQRKLRQFEDKYSLQTKTGCKTIRELQKELTCLLNKKCILEQYLIEKRDFDFLYNVRKIQNKLYYKLQILENFGKEKVSIAQRIYLFSIPTISRIAANNKILARELFRLQRTRMIKQ